MRAKYFILCAFLWLTGFIIHTKIECQNVTSINIVWESDEEKICDNITDITDLNSTATTVTTLLPTEPPKRKLYKDVLQCPPLPVNRLHNGKIRLLPNAKIQYICNRGYKLIGPSVIRCFEGRWTSKIKPMCILPSSSCGPPEPIAHGQVHGNDWADGSRIFYICDQGYVLLGSRERTCDNGYWSSIAPICQVENEPLTGVAARLKDEFVEKVGAYSSDSRGRSIGTNIELIGLELFLLIDKSSSVDPVDFKRGIEFAKFLIDEFGVKNGEKDKSTGTRIGVITFSSKANFAIRLNDATVRSKEDAISRLDGLKPEGGGTSINQALVIVATTKQTLREKAKKAIFLLTDGHDNSVGGMSPSVVANDLKKNDFEIFTVGIGRDINKIELTSIASEPARNHVFLLDKFSELGDILWLIRNSPDEVPPMRPSTCGVVPKIKGKDFREAVPGFPWLAVIYVKFPPKRNHESYSMGICSGSLICSQWVLTSGSCFYGEDKSAKSSKVKNTFVTLGEDDLSKEDKTEKNFRVSFIVFHPKFSPWSGADNDVALVKLKSPAPMELVYRPVCLPTGDQVISLQKKENPYGTMAGWGTVPSDVFFEGNFASAFKTLPEVTKIPLIDDARCNKIKHKSSTNAFCAGSRVRQTCSGNLGSPLIVEDTDSNVHYIFGVLSNRKYCNSHYNVFTEILRHVSWINNITANCQENQ